MGDSLWQSVLVHEVIVATEEFSASAFCLSQSCTRHGHSCTSPLSAVSSSFPPAFGGTECDLVSSLILNRPETSHRTVLRPAGRQRGFFRNNLSAKKSKVGAKCIIAKLTRSRVT